MQNQTPESAFQEVHRKIQAAKDSLRKAQEARADSRRKDAELEAVERGFDRPATKPVV